MDLIGKLTQIVLTTIQTTQNTLLISLPENLSEFTVKIKTLTDENTSNEGAVLMM